LEGWGFGGAEIISDEVNVAEGNGQRLGWVAEEEFGGEAADCDVFAKDGVKESDVGKGTKGAGDIGGEGSGFEVRDGRDGGVDEESRARWGRGVCG
jgi:hypothetical protein